MCLFQWYLPTHLNRTCMPGSYVSLFSCGPLLLRRGSSSICYTHHINVYSWWSDWLAHTLADAICVSQIVWPNKKNQPCTPWPHCPSGWPFHAPLPPPHVYDVDDEHDDYDGDDKKWWWVCCVHCGDTWYYLMCGDPPLSNTRTHCAGILWEKHPPHSIWPRLIWLRIWRHATAPLFSWPRHIEVTTSREISANVTTLWAPRN